jgi:diketogulonate reductase-like aldo/keto reductase
MALALDSTIDLGNGVKIPRLGLGVWRAAPGGETRRAVAAALAEGYRHIDTAAVYGNEEDVGAAVRESGIPRDQIFVTTKLWNDDQGSGAARAFEATLKRLGLEYVDLYLIHWPVPKLRLGSWRLLEQLQAEGRCRAIGVSNFTERHLDELLDQAQKVPAVNQVEMSPFLAQQSLRAYCAKKGIVIEAYSPLTKGRRFDHPGLQEVARRVKRTPAQVLIRWALQQDVVVLPKSVRLERIRENAAVYDFALAAADLAALDQLDEGFRTAWDPSEMP